MGWYDILYCSSDKMGWYDRCTIAATKWTCMTAVLQQMYWYNGSTVIRCTGLAAVSWWGKTDCYNCST